MTRDNATTIPTNAIPPTLPAGWYLFSVQDDDDSRARLLTGPFATSTAARIAEDSLESQGQAVGGIWHYRPLHLVQP
jgi:hypothetical protein